MTGVEWAWMRSDRPSDKLVWIGGTLAESFARVSSAGGTYILVSSLPGSAYREVMARVAESDT